MKKYILFLILHLVCSAPSGPASSSATEPCATVGKVDPYLARARNIQPASAKEVKEWLKGPKIAILMQL